MVIIGPRGAGKSSRMGIEYPGRWTRALGAGALLFSSLSLSGCVTSTAGSPPLDAHAEAPAPASSYLPVEDLPSNRERPAMTATEQAKLKKELTAARDRQMSRVKAREGAPSAKP
jgi:hypothetical protein